MVNAIISSFETTHVSLACLNWAVVLCLAVDFSLMAVEVWFVGKGAVVAGWIVACEISVPLFGTWIS